MKRVAFKMKLMPGCAVAYKERHAQLWPQMQAELKKAGIRNYSIFLDEETNTLFAYQEVLAADSSQDLGKRSEIVQQWWDYMADIMETYSDNSPVSTVLSEVFYLE
ncbi:L-rhamnose mutarotase [bacterium A37T11]|nr:L-rhamnose mutarotase [bacterium A37T11]